VCEFLVSSVRAMSIMAANGCRPLPLSLAPAALGHPWLSEAAAGGAAELLMSDRPTRPPKHNGREGFQDLPAIPGKKEIPIWNPMLSAAIFTKIRSGMRRPDGKVYCAPRNKSFLPPATSTPVTTSCAIMARYDDSWRGYFSQSFRLSR
jgi:hypothetical protein